MTNATVKRFNDTLGYGFAETEHGDIFIHYTQIKMDGFKTLKPNQKILIDIYERFDENNNMIGYEAKNIKSEE